MFILNPGDGHDVSTFDSKREAFIALENAFSADRNFAKLYRRNDAGEFSYYERGHWIPVERDNLQIKVLDAVPRTDRARVKP